MVYRVNRGYTINHLEKRHEIIKNFSDYDNYAQRISELVDRYFGIKTTTNGKLYLAIPFFTRNITDTISYLMDKIRMKIYEDVGIIINDKKMLNNLAIHLSYSLNRMTFNIKVKNSLDFSIKDKYKLAYQLAEISASVIEKEKNLICNYPMILKSKKTKKLHLLFCYNSLDVVQIIFFFDLNI